jgi:hypothetical protein
MYYTGDTYNSYFILNYERAKRCKEAWLSVEGDCTDGEAKISLTDWDKARAVVFKALPYSDGSGVIPTSGGWNHLVSEFSETCANNPYRFMSFKDGIATATNFEHN